MSLLYLGDSAKVLEQIPNESIDLTVTSPPYDNLRDYHGFVFDFEKIANELFRVTKKGGIIVWIVADATINGSETGTSFKQALYFKEIGFNIHDTMIWEKDGFSAVGSLAVRYAPVFEYMFVLSKGEPKTFNPIKDRKNLHSYCKLEGTIRNPDGTTKRMSGEGKTLGEYGQRYNVWNITPEHSNKERCHPAQFPVQLAKDHIISWSNKGDTVLDPFLGSGTTGIAAYQTGRKFIGIEISKEYFEIAKKRIKEVEAQLIIV